VIFTSNPNIISTDYDLPAIYGLGGQDPRGVDESNFDGLLEN